MIERVVTLGANQQLVGTHCAPTASPAASTGFILLNAGVIQRMGPRRFNVKLARQLAQAGFHSLRVDLSGQGDSRPAAGTASHEEQVRADLQAAMDCLQAACGIERFVIAGICSGAIAGLDMAQRDTRVVGLWMLDGHVYATFKARLARYHLQLTRAFRVTMADWFGKLAGGARKPNTQAPRYSGDDTSRAPSREAFADILDKLADRGVRMYLMYSSDLLWHYSYQGQFKDTFKGRRFVDKVRCDFLKEIDHTVTALSAQQDVIARIQDWADGFRQPHQTKRA